MGGDSGESGGEREMGTVDDVSELEEGRGSQYGCVQSGSSGPRGLPLRAGRLR